MKNILISFKRLDNPANAGVVQGKSVVDIFEAVEVAGVAQQTKHPKRAVGGLIFRSGFRDVHKTAKQPCDFPAQSTARTNRS